MGQTTSLTLRIPTKLKQRLEKLAEATLQPESSLAAAAIARYVQSQEAKIEAIREGLADIRSGRVASDEDVDAWLSSWGTDHEVPPPKCA